MTTAQTPRIAVLGAGSSGLVTLKCLNEYFPASAVTCFEKGNTVRGAWGSRGEDFVSTSTKYTTQFSCFQEVPQAVAHHEPYGEFFRGGEYGDYLERFVEHFKLRQQIAFGVEVRSIKFVAPKWELLLKGPNGEFTQTFDAIFICTGLVSRPRKLSVSDSRIRVQETPEGIRDSRVVVVGGGESAVDVANTLARAELGNTVFLSLRSGIRVSPRYHPIRKVPSDFLRNRLLLSVDKRWRNAIGERFVTFRIKHRKLLEALFPKSRREMRETSGGSNAGWELRLMSRARNELFNVFHNKSDAFLQAVTEGRITIVGPPVDDSFQSFFDFEQTEQVSIAPQVVVPSAGYYPLLETLSAGALALKDFYLGCLHSTLPNCFLIGHARPVIGNIPTMSELQAKYCSGLLAGRFARPVDIVPQTETQWLELTREFPSINTQCIYPVEHIPYCDLLAKAMGIYPTRRALGSLRLWLKWLLAPASTSHYLDQDFDRPMLETQPIHMPAVLALLVGAIRLFQTQVELMGKGRSIR
ncbi:MAG: NAD(P)-binding domain-containing protein [Bdellovibrionales bacterium]|nr:NAD(P)-binding domain-containing protein [Bdellovibrionales bacterium]